MYRGEELVREMLGGLVRINTVNPPGDEARAAEYMAKVLEKYGIPSHVQYVDEGRANVVAEIGEGESTLVLTGHLDVVPVTDKWSTDPFDLIESDGRFIGRGVSDMKGGVAAMAAAAIMAKEAGLIKNGKVVLAFVADEEVNGTGTKALIRDMAFGEKTTVVIGEPTENCIAVAHRGVIRFRITASGIACHSGQPWNGENALVALAKVICRIHEFDMERRTEKFGVLPPPTVSCTMMSSGEKDNIVPGTASCILDCRTIPGDTPESLSIKLREAIEKAEVESDRLSVSIETVIEVRPAVIEEDSRAVKMTSRAYENAFGTKPQVRDFPACSDMPFLRDAGLEAFLCGPGSIAQAHTDDEFISFSQLEDALRLYIELIKENELFL